mgnify:CR=1 FL=1
MTKIRYLIEKSGDPYMPLALTKLEKGDDDGRGCLVSDMGEAKRLADQAASLCGVDEIIWRLPPIAWQPDAILISQWMDDGIEENRDR